MAFNRQTAIQYLAGNPNFSPDKDLNSYSTAQLIRYARAYEQAEQVGRVITQLEARGHLASPVQHNPKNPKTGRNEEHKIQPVLFGTKNARQESVLTVSDLRRLMRKARIQDEFNLIIIEGWVKYRGITVEKQTVSGYLSKKAIDKWLKDHKNSFEDLTSFASLVSGIQKKDWESVTSVAVSYPQNIKGVQRQ